MAWQDIKNAVLADTCYCDNQLAAKDVSVNLPAVSFLTTEVKAMGNMDVVLAGIIEALEATVTKIGTDMGLAKMCTPEKHSYEFRWAQNVVTSDGSAKVEGCKAFITGTPKGVPGLGIEVAANSEGEIAIAATRYQLYAGGSEILCIDRLAQICRINGKDYYSPIASVL